MGLGRKETTFNIPSMDPGSRQGAALDRFNARGTSLTMPQSEGSQMGREAFSEGLEGLRGQIGAGPIDFGGVSARARAASDARARQGVSSVAQSLGGDTSSPAFAALAGKIASGSAAGTAGQMADLEVQTQFAERGRMDGLYAQLAQLGLSGESVIGGNDSANFQAALQFALGNRQITSADAASKRAEGIAQQGEARSDYVLGRIGFGKQPSVVPWR